MSRSVAVYYLRANFTLRARRIPDTRAHARTHAHTPAHLSSLVIKNALGSQDARLIRSTGAARRGAVHPPLRVSAPRLSLAQPRASSTRKVPLREFIHLALPLSSSRPVTLISSPNFGTAKEREKEEDHTLAQVFFSSGYPHFSHRFLSWIPAPTIDFHLLYH